MHEKTDLEARHKVWDLIKDIKVTLMVTHDDEGALRSRPMAAQQDKFEGDLWFVTKADSAKIDDISSFPDVLLAYADPGSSSYVSVSGTAEIVEDRAMIKQLWSEMLRIWFPKGSDDPNIALIKVNVHSAEYWDTASSTMVLAYGYIKARITGKEPEMGDHGKVKFG